jgi:hypothetical protein
LRVDHAGSLVPQGAGGLAIAGEDDLVVSDSHGLGARTLAIEGQHAPIDDQDIGLLHDRPRFCRSWSKSRQS